MGETLGKRIVQNRKRLGLTQDALAEKLGVTAQAVSKWENDQSCPDITTLPRLANIFGTTTDALLGVEPPAKESELITEDVPSLHIDEFDDQWQFTWESGRKGHIGIGLWVILAALMMLAANYLGQHVSLWTALWTTGLTVFGIFGLWPSFSFLRLGCGLIGGYFIVGELWPRLFILEKSYILPICLLLFGLSLLADAGNKDKKHGFHITMPNKRKHLYQVSGEEFTCEIAFCDQSYLVDLPRLSKGSAAVAFGDLELRLTGCQEFAANCTLDLSCSFGDLTILLPRNLRAETSSSTTFADFSVIGAPDPDAAVILVNANASFGDITLRYI